MDQHLQGPPITHSLSAMVALCTCPSRHEAERLARRIVENRAAACVNIIPGVQSVYRWQGEIAQDEECLLLVKTTKERFETLAGLIVDEHPYELPEVIAVSIEHGLSAYLRWIEDEVR